jgi:hypothetical protein
MKLTTKELDEEADRVRQEVEDARKALAALESKLEWLLKGQELLGGAGPAAARPSKKPTLTRAILTVIGEGEPGGWTALQVMDELRARGWMPNGTSAEHVVRARLAALARGDEAMLRRISLGVYELKQGSED